MAQRIERKVMNRLTRRIILGVIVASIVIVFAVALWPSGGTLLNKINSIAATNPIYQTAIERGRELLELAGYGGGG